MKNISNPPSPSTSNSTGSDLTSEHPPSSIAANAPNLQNVANQLSGSLLAELPTSIGPADNNISAASLLENDTTEDINAARILIQMKQDRGDQREQKVDSKHSFNKNQLKSTSSEDTMFLPLPLPLLEETKQSSEAQPYTLKPKTTTKSKLFNVRKDSSRADGGGAIAGRHSKPIQETVSYLSTPITSSNVPQQQTPENLRFTSEGRSPSSVHRPVPRHPIQEQSVQLPQNPASDNEDEHLETPPNSPHSNG